MEPTTNTMSTKIIVALVIGLLVGFAAGVFWQSRRDTVKEALPTGTEETATTTEEEGEEESTSATTASTTSTSVSAKGLIIEDQTAGDTVEVASLDATEVLWVAVRDEKDGKLGNILGARKVFPGAGQQVSVQLLRSTVPGGMYRVVVYRDIGDTTFHQNEDVMLEGVGGSFTAK